MFKNKLLLVNNIADINICYKEHARRYLNAGGHSEGRYFLFI